MAIPLVNSIASWFLKKRFHQIELFLKYPNEVQTELLQGEVKTTCCGHLKHVGSQNRVVQPMQKANLYLLLMSL